MASRPRTNDARAFVVLDNLNRDLRFAVRRLRRSPTFAAGVVATMAVGVASTIGIGTLVFAVLLRPLPYASPETLVRVLVATPGLDTRATESSPGLFVYFRERAQSFASLGSYYVNDGVTITDGPQAERTTAARLSPSVLEMLDTRPDVGRLFRDEDARVRDAPVLISYDLWVRRFGRDPDVIGKTIEVNLGRRSIIGVLPRGFDFPSPSVTVWYPDEISASRADLNDRYLDVIVRLRPGVTGPRRGECSMS